MPAFNRTAVGEQYKLLFLWIVNWECAIELNDPSKCDEDDVNANNKTVLKYC